MSLSPAPRWRCNSPGAIALRDFDGEFVVRNEFTGNTHLLGALAASVLKVLVQDDSGVSTEDIAARLCNGPVERDPLDLRAAVDEVLFEFKRLGLAEMQGG